MLVTRCSQLGSTNISVHGRDSSGALIDLSRFSNALLAKTPGLSRFKGQAPDFVAHLALGLAVPSVIQSDKDMAFTGLFDQRANLGRVWHKFVFAVIGENHKIEYVELDLLRAVKLRDAGINEIIGLRSPMWRTISVQDPSAAEMVCAASHDAWTAAQARTPLLKRLPLMTPQTMLTKPSGFDHKAALGCCVALWVLMRGSAGFPEISRRAIKTSELSARILSTMCFQRQQLPTPFVERTPLFGETEPGTLVHRLFIM